MMTQDFLTEATQSNDFNFIYNRYKKFLWEHILKHYKIEKDITSKVKIDSTHEKIREVIVRSVLSFLQLEIL